MANGSTDRALDFRDNEKMFSPMAPDTATKGVQAQMEVVVAKEPSVDVGAANLAGQSLHQNFEGLKYQPPAPTGKGFGQESINSVANLGMETMNSLFSILNPATDLEQSTPAPQMAMNHMPKPGVFGL